MPRFTPRLSDARPDQDADLLMKAVLRPNLRRAFPLPRDDNLEEEQFRRVLADLQQRTSPERRADLQGS